MQENPILSAILGRRSVRRYTGEALTKEEIEKIIEAGRFAPSAKNVQPWRFIVITDRKLIAELSRDVRKAMKRILKFRFVLQLFSRDLRNAAMVNSLRSHANNAKDTIFFDAPALIFIVSRKGHFFKESCACAAENMMLAAHSMGIGSCWIGFARFLEMGSAAFRKIGIPRGHRVAAALVFGHPENAKLEAPKRKEEAGIVKWIG